MAKKVGASVNISRERMEELARNAEKERKRKEQKAAAVRKHFGGIAERAARDLWNSRRARGEIAEKWGLPEDAMRKFGIGFAHRPTKVNGKVENLPGITLPYRDMQGRVVDIGWRLMPSFEDKYKGIRYRPYISIGERAIGYIKMAPKSSVWYLFEGEMKAYKMAHFLGINVVFVPGVSSVNAKFASPPSTAGWILRVVYDEPSLQIMRFAINTASVFSSIGWKSEIVCPMHDNGRKIDDMTNENTSQKIREWLETMTVNPAAPYRVMGNILEKYMLRATPGCIALAEEAMGSLARELERLKRRNQQKINK